MKIAIFFLLTLAADGSDSSCKGRKLPVQNKTISINTTFCSDTGLGKAFHEKYTQEAEKCCDLKFACLQICGIDKEKCKEFGRLKGSSTDCDPEKRCKNEQGIKKDECEKDFRALEKKVQKKFREQREEPCDCKRNFRRFVSWLRKDVLNSFAGADKDCLKNVNYSDNTVVAEWFLKIIKKKVIGTNVCADFEKMSVMAVEIDSDSSTALANQ